MSFFAATSAICTNPSRQKLVDDLGVECMLRMVAAQRAEEMLHSLRLRYGIFARGENFGVSRGLSSWLHWMMLVMDDVS